MSEWKSKCCGVEIYEKKTNHASPFGFYYCSKCHEPCETKEDKPQDTALYASLRR